MRQTHTAPPGAGAIGEQVASEQNERATWRGYFSCCSVLVLHCTLFVMTLKSVMSGLLSAWVGLLSN